MNAKELYQTIGQIDDDLILNAGAARSKRQRPVFRFWMIAAAACLCMVLFGGYLRFFGTVLMWNEGTTENAAKFSIPEGSSAQSLPVDALADYYHITLPDTLDDLLRISADAQIYKDAQGRVVYDCNVFRYESTDGGKKLNLILSRVSSVPENNGEKLSKIRGISVTLTEDTSVPDAPLLCAQWEQNGTNVRLSAEGVNQDELIAVLKQLV